MSLRYPLSLACLVASLMAGSAVFAGERPKQLLIVSFDGAGDNRMWVKSRAIAARTGANFTYFLSCTNLIERARATSYKAPGKKAGRSNVGFAPSADDVAIRLDHIWNARAEGHEIASHGCGHFDGGDWSKQDWLTEMATFRDVVENAWVTAGVAEREPEGWRDFTKNEIIGFRAPYLSAGSSLIEAEKAFGHVYDASPVARVPQWPERDGKLYLFGLPLIPEGPKARRIVAMDYNLFIRHSMGVDTPARSAEFEARAYQAFRAAFDREYDNDRNPLQIGLHFPQMNDGAYWRAMDRLVSEVCGKADVGCVTYAQAIDALREKEKGPVIATTDPSL